MRAVVGDKAAADKAADQAADKAAAMAMAAALMAVDREAEAAVMATAAALMAVDKEAEAEATGMATATATTTASAAAAAMAVESGARATAATVAAFMAVDREAEAAAMAMAKAMAKAMAMAMVMAMAASTIIINIMTMQQGMVDVAVARAAVHMVVVMEVAHMAIIGMCHIMTAMPASSKRRILLREAPATTGLARVDGRWSNRALTHTNLPYGHSGHWHLMPRQCLIRRMSSTNALLLIG